MRRRDLFSFDRQESTFRQICACLNCKCTVPAWPDLFGRSIKQYLLRNDIAPIKTLSLFSGAGGLDIGFNDVGFDIVEAVEIENKFCQTLELNSGENKFFRHSKVNCVDIRDFSGKHLEKIDFIIGGPPCQTFSAAGRRANGVLGITDERGVLFREYIRLIQELSPVGFLFENVYGITGAQQGKAWEEILKRFSEVGYELYYRVVDAADYGVPQHRERLIIVGLKTGSFKFPRPTHGPDSIDDEPFYSARNAVAGVILTPEESKTGIGGRYGYLLNDIPPGLNYSFYTEEMGHPNPIFAWRSKFSDYLYKADPDEPVRTIKASGGAYTGPFHWENRFFACSEYKRLQTFPDDYKISGTKQVAVKQIGNSVPPQLARMMALAIRVQVFNTKFPFTLPLLEAHEVLTFRKRKRELTAIYQQKAQAAIEIIARERVNVPRSRTYYCSMSDLFKFAEVEKSKGNFKIIVEWGNRLEITIEPTYSKTSECKMTFAIKPNKGGWNLNVEEVEMKVFSEDLRAFTIAWKAFEHELIRNSIKADLIQLNGYYQYASNLLCHCELKFDTAYKEILQTIVSGLYVSQITSSEMLAACWKVRKEALINIAEFLRSLGYEIRNHNTNPQIDEGYWLIPYSFPTLTYQSVQLRKSVR